MTHITNQKSQNPKPVVDIIIHYKKGIVLIKRKYPPYGWALPGGFVEYEETLEHTAVREAKEETNLKVKLLRQFHCYSDPHRDPRGHTIATVFVAQGEGVLKGQDDAAEAKVFLLNKLPKEMAFDHKKILQDYLHKKY